MPCSLDTLPSELYTAVLRHIPGGYLASSTYALICALPRAPIPLSHLFEIVHVRRADQIFALYKRLRKSPTEAAWVKEFHLRTWEVDADLLVGLLRLLKDLRNLTMWIGPNFAPEHMEDILEAPQTQLQTINFRFRPYVERATYEQFLKGAYFDSTLARLAQWPCGRVARLSIVQDPYEVPADEQAFAQPMVFFRLDAAAILARSPLAQDLPALKLRVPQRPVARNLVAEGVFPTLRILDLSTTFCPGVDVESLLGHLRNLHALILDGCSLVKAGAGGEEDWRTIGHVCATAGLRLARERERKLRAWLERKAALEAVSAQTPRTGTSHVTTPPPVLRGSRKPVKTKKGLSSAMNNLSLGTSGGEMVLAIPKIRILPAYSSLRALSTTVPFIDDLPFEVSEALADGWRDGVRVVQSSRARLRTSLSHGVRITRILEHHEREVGEKVTNEDGMDGLKEVSKLDPVWEEDERVYEPPVFCLAGASKQSVHPEGCAHRYAWDVWDE